MRKTSNELVIYLYTDQPNAKLPALRERCKCKLQIKGSDIIRIRENMQWRKRQ
jgi:hypothetical protein